MTPASKKRNKVWWRVTAGAPVATHALVAVALLMSSCGPWPFGDCFLVVKGRVLECGTTTPVAGATISTRIDRGIHGKRTLSDTFSTDNKGSFEVHTDGSEPCSSWATLTFEKPGFESLSMQFKGSTKTPAEVCLTRAASP